MVSLGGLNRAQTRLSALLELEKFAEAFGLGAADRDFGVFSVVHFEDVGGLEPGYDFLDVMNVDEEGAMGAEERFGGQGFFEFVDGAGVGSAFQFAGDDGD